MSRWHRYREVFRPRQSCSENLTLGLIPTATPEPVFLLHYEQHLADGSVNHSSSCINTRPSQWPPPPSIGWPARGPASAVCLHPWWSAACEPGLASQRVLISGVAPRFFRRQTRSPRLLTSLCLSWGLLWWHRRAKSTPEGQSPSSAAMFQRNGGKREGPRMTMYYTHTNTQSQNIYTHAWTNAPRQHPTTSSWFRGSVVACT